MVVYKDPMKKGLAPFVSLHQCKLLIAPLSRPSSTQNDVDVKRCLRILRGTVLERENPAQRAPRAWMHKGL